MVIRLIGCSVGLLLPLITVAFVVAEQAPSRGEEEVLQLRLQRMLQSVETLRQADQADLAHEAATRAEAIARELQKIRERRAAEPRRSHERPDPRAQAELQWRAEVIQRLNELREQVHGLRDEVAGLRQQLDDRRRHEAASRFGQVDLSGRWLMTLPAGFEYETLIAPRGDGLFQVKVRGNLAGLYRHQGNRLSVEIPSDERLTEFVWEFQNEKLLLLMEAPPVAKVGADYRGATLQRIPGDSATAVDH